MNREIKFRGKRLDNGEWVYGYYSCFKNFGPCIHVSPTMVYGVDPNTVGQYIGLLDKNGKDIYEWDVRYGKYFCMKEECETMNVMRWDDLESRFYWEMLKGGEMPDFISTEIIGNLHDNPELLK